MPCSARFQATNPLCTLRPPSRAAGFVERQRSDRDSRNVLVSLTSRGRNATDRASERVVACEDAMFAELSRADVASLVRILAKVGASHDPMHAVGPK